MFAYFLFLLAALTGANVSPQVILVTIDGVRWQEVFQGTDPARDQGHHLDARQLVPNLYNSFVDKGMVVGRDTPMIASGPNHVSLPGYLEITRGHPSTDCQSNYCSPKIDQSIFFWFQHPAVFSSWISIRQTIPTKSNVYADVGTDWYRLDRATELAANNYLKTHNPDFLWVSLGDTDEYAHDNNYPQYITALQGADVFIGSLVNKYPNATIIVTVDHGRNANFKDHGISKDSERVWLMMRSPTIPVKGFVSAKPISLSNILYTVADIAFDTHSPASILSLIDK